MSKNTTRVTRIAGSVIGLLILVSDAAVVQAATLTWDADTGTTSAQDGSGTWNTTNTNWWNGSGNVTWNNATPDRAVFGAGGTGNSVVNLDVPITSGPLTFNAGASYTLTGNTLTTSSSITVNSPEARIDSAITGGALHKFGSGTLALTGNNTFGGSAIDVRAGILNIRHNNALGSSGYCHVYVSNAALEVQDDISVSNNLYIKGYGAGNLGSLRSISGDNIWAGWVRMHWDVPNTAIGVDAGSTLTITGQIHPAGGSNGALHKIGDGTLILTNSNTYHWPTYVDAGVMNIRHNNALGTTAGGTTVASGAALEMENNITVGTEALTLTGSGVSGNGVLRSISGDNVWNGSVVENSAHIRVDADTLTINGQISGSGTFRKYGAGKLILTGNNNYAATTDLVAGVLNIRHSSALGISSYCHVYSGATLELENNLNIPRGLYIGNSTSGNTALNLHSISGNNTWGEYVRLHNSHPHARVGVDAGSTLTISGRIEDGNSGSLTKLGGGTLIFTRDNIYNAPTYVEQGVLNIRHGSALGTTTAGNGTTVSSGAALQMQGDITVAAEALSLSGYGISSTGVLRSLSGDNAWGGAVTLASHSYIGVNADSLTISGPISGSNMYKYGSGKLILSGNNTFGGGGAMDVRQGTLNLQHNKALGNSGYCHVNAGRTLELEGSISVGNGMYIGNNNSSDSAISLHNVSGDNIWNGYVRLHSGHPYARISVDAGSTLTINGNIDRHANGTGSLTKLGAGTMIVNYASNAYNSPTHVEEGTLLVNGSIAASPSVSVSSGAILGGSGIVPVIDGDGLVSPGNSAGILAAPSVDPSGGLDFAFEFTSTGSPDYTNASASINDVLRLTDLTDPFASLLDGDNRVDVYLNVAGLAKDDVFTGGFYTDLGNDFLGDISAAQFDVFIRGDGAGSNEFGGVNYYTLAEYSACMGMTVDTIAEMAAFQSGSVNGYVMQLTASVPEPSTVMLLLLGCLGLFWHGRRSR